MLHKRKEQKTSPFSGLYDILIQKDHFLRQFKELVDFSFVYDMLEHTYSHDNGRGAIDPVEMFKYLILKVLYNLSDVDIVERATTDMAIKYFLDRNPEDTLIDPSSLTKFRRNRLKECGINLLDTLIAKTVEIAKKEGLLKGTSLIVDSTHTTSKYSLKSPVETLKEQNKKLRKSIYAADESMKGKLPEKPLNNDLQEEIEHSKELIETAKKNKGLIAQEEVRTMTNLVQELIEDEAEIRKLSTCETDAKVGHKDADSSFLGYKSHIAMNEDRVIVAATVTSGEKHDGKELETLINKARKAGATVDTVIGDAAYSEKANIELCEKEGLNLVSRLSKTVTHTNAKYSEDFEYNKDAGRYVCKDGHMSIKKAVNGKKKRLKDGSAMVETYYFDVEKCKVCPHKEGCYKEGSATKSFSVTIKSHSHQKHEDFQNTDLFKEKAKDRYMIEAKNAELKNNHSFDKTNYLGIDGMGLQCGTAVFVVNIKRLITLKFKK